MKVNREVLEQWWTKKQELENEKPPLLQRYRDALQRESMPLEQAVQKTKEELPGDEAAHEFVRRLIKQSKQLSQLVARSWFGDEVGLAIRDYFVKPYKTIDIIDATSGTKIEIIDADGRKTNKIKDADGRLKELLGADPAKQHSNEPPLSLLLNIFEKDELPLYSEYELQVVYSFSVDLNNFEGSLDDISGPSRTGDSYFNIVIPYPPRPALSNVTVTMEELEEWVQQQILDENGNVVPPIFPDNVYIPPTCC
ncbi:MAG: hypothetical protein KME08_13100 [Aphanothece sp. CMT-3BRIN-NPC111]|jgi:hypothetical protein|nr:hypothetical protein [Aphanothece sp. CMT-3BRIN-NPC111]